MNKLTPAGIAKRVTSRLVASSVFAFSAVAGCVVENNVAPAAPGTSTVAATPSSTGAVVTSATTTTSATASTTPIATPTTTSTATPTATATATPTGTAAGNATAPTDDMLGCALDTDCVAVPQNGCCNNGAMVAVATKSTDAYKKSFTCPPPRPMCPMYMVLDTRVAECSNASHKCEMVAPDQVKCGGFIRNHHACPAGYQCKLAAMPDMPGTCAK